MIDILLLSLPNRHLIQRIVSSVMANDLSESSKPTSKLRRDLGTVESYAALIGILIGAGIFRVTSDAWELTGPSVILGYALLTPVILSTSIPYAAYLSTPLGKEPGGEYLHISRTLKGYRLAYIGCWLKIISYIGAAAYLSNACFAALQCTVVDTRQGGAFSFRYRFEGNTPARRHPTARVVSSQR